MDLRRALLACCLLLLAALVASGCGGEQSDDPRDATPNTPDASETTTTETETTETETETETHSTDKDAAEDAPASSTTAEAALQVDVRATGTGAPSASLALACPVDHFANNDVRAACTLLGTTPALVTTPAATSGCTAVTGQPQTATVTGTLNGAAVNAAFSRKTSCEVERWDAALPLFTAAGYAA
ncbi:MAG: hypothetical protein JWM90_1146 [Thermoleophilia bacterium]|nr:hypothetical protein [Thermoleophilia bacterium]